MYYPRRFPVVNARSGTVKCLNISAAWPGLDGDLSRRNAAKAEVVDFLSTADTRLETG
jgi:hypothetical protein